MAETAQRWMEGTARRARHVRRGGNTVLAARIEEPIGESRAARHTRALTDLLADTLIPPLGERAGNALETAAAAGRGYAFRPTRVEIGFSAEPCGKHIRVTVWARWKEGEAPPQGWVSSAAVWTKEGLFLVRRARNGKKRLL